MALDQKQQVLEIINRSNTILIPLLEENGGALGSALALYYILQKMNKKVLIFSQNKYAGYDFLETSLIKDSISGLTESIISIDITKYPIKELKYETSDTTLDIHLTPKKQPISLEDLTFKRGQPECDLILTLNTPDLSKLGSIFSDNSELFYAKPILNIDTNLANEMYGKVNFVDISVSCTSELVYSLIQDLKGVIDQKVATALLFGIISETDNFQGRQTTPNSFLISSKLLELGAKRDDIVRVLYKTKGLPMMKLLGRLLAHVAFSQPEGQAEVGGRNKIAFSKLYRHDFDKTETSETDLPVVLKDFVTHLPMDVFCAHVMYEGPDSHTKKGVIVLLNNANSSQLANILNGELIQGAIHYKMATPDDIHKACDEVNKKIFSVFGS